MITACAAAAFGLGQHVGTVGDLVQVGSALGQRRAGFGATASSARGAVGLGQGQRPGHGGFGGVGGTPHVQARNQAQAGGVLDGLVRRAVFAQANRSRA